jgi:hypothetical protein
MIKPIWKNLLIMFGILSIAFTSCQTNSTPTSCSFLHTGVFSYNVKLQNGETIPFAIYRNDSTQIEVANESNDTTVFAITWPKDCSYDLLLQKSSFAMPQDMANLSKSIPLQTSIDYVGKDFYIFTAQRKANNFSLTDTLRFVPIP